MIQKLFYTGQSQLYFNGRERWIYVEKLTFFGENTIFTPIYLLICAERCNFAVCFAK